MKTFCLLLTASMFFILNASANSAPKMSKEIKSNNSPLFACKTAGTDWKAEISLDSASEGLLKLNHGKAATWTKCSLKLVSFLHGPQDIIPGARIEFQRETCVPALGLRDGEILKNQILMIDLTSDSRAKGRLQYLTSAQPESCKLGDMKGTDLRLAELKWQNQSRLPAGHLDRKTSHLDKE